jgi:transcriptional regulator with XRE-family HTH domain
MIRIRKEVLRISQAQMAAVAGVSQGTVSKWEAGELEPDRDQLAKIRSFVTARGIEWRDSWFFDPAPASDNAGAVS